MNKDQEEFEKVRKRLYALADKMGMQISMIVKRKPSNALAPHPVVSRAPREPGEE